MDIGSRGNKAGPRLTAVRTGRKGVTPVLSTIVLVIFAVALGGSAWYFLQGIYGAYTSKTISTPIGAGDCKMGSTEIIIRDTGTESISLGQAPPADFGSIRNHASNPGFEEVECIEAECEPESWDVTIPLGSDVALVIDISWSMRGQKLSDAKAAAQTFLDQMNPDYDRVGLVNFSTQAFIMSGLTSDFNSLDSFIDSLSATGTTDIAGGIKNATSVLSSGDGGVKVQVFLSDGEPNRCLAKISSTAEAAHCAMLQAATAKDAGIKIYTIGLDVALGGVAERTLMNISSITGGKYYSAPTSSQLAEIYVNISREITNGVSQAYAVYGSYSMMSEAGKGNKAESSLIEATQGSSHRLEFYIKLDPLAAGSLNAKVYFYAADGSTAGQQPLATYSSVIAEFSKQTLDVTIPSGASYAKLSFEWSDDSSGTAYIDDMYLGPASPCQVSGASAVCGEISIEKTGDGGLRPFFSSSSIASRDFAKFKDANCQGFCTYTFISPSGSAGGSADCR